MKGLLAIGHLLGLTQGPIDRTMAVQISCNSFTYTGAAALAKLTSQLVQALLQLRLKPHTDSQGPFCSTHC
jgi:hypothetical protein